MGSQFDKASSMAGLSKAAAKCLSGSRHKDGPVEFVNTCLGSCGKLQKELRTGKYHLRPGKQIEIFRPKKRTADAPWFRDRVWQKAMVNNGLYEDLTKGFIEENYACQRGKGTDRILRRIVALMQELHRQAPDSEIYGRHLDIRKYFPSTPHRLLHELDERIVTEPDYLPYLYEIVESKKDQREESEINADPFGRRGTGLGSEINQLHQVSLLNELDHKIKEICPAYVRYNDDFLILSHSREDLQKTVDLIAGELESKGLKMVDKNGCFRISNGFYFMQKKFIMLPGGKIIIKMKPEAIAAERQHLRAMKRLMDEGWRDYAAVQRHYQSWVANAEYCGDGPIRKMDEYYKQVFGRKPEYKRSRRYLYGGKSMAERCGGSAQSQAEPESSGSESGEAER